MTNFEKIKAMTVEEMAKTDMGVFFSCPYNTPYVGCKNEKKFDSCVDCTKHWLESEAEE